VIPMPRKKKVAAEKPEKKYHIFFDGCCDAGGFYVESTELLKEAKCPDCGAIANHLVTVIELE